MSRHDQAADLTGGDMRGRYPAMTDDRTRPIRRTRAGRQDVRTRAMAVTLAPVVAILAAPMAAAQPAGAAAFERGFGGGCHRPEAQVPRAIPHGTEAERRAWIAAFMDRHPCHCDEARPAIHDHLVQRTAR
jgi:hypothetical protein